MSPELLSRFEPVAREQLKQVVTNRVLQSFTADSFKVEGEDPLVITFLYAPRRDATMLYLTPLFAFWGARENISSKGRRREKTSVAFTLKAT